MHRLISFAFLCLITCAISAPAQPAFYTEKINSIPDLTQTDKRANFPGGGRQYCCLVAIANSFMWLDSNGFENLVRNTGKAFEDEVALVKLLGSKAYMDTDLVSGTGTTKLMRGVKKYVEERGYQIQKLEYQGWRKHPGEMRTEYPIPRLNWIKQGIIGNGSVWLNVGWYQYNVSRNEYKRIAGHWVTLVGYGKDENGKLNPNILILHDPSPRAGEAFNNEYAIVSRIRSGRLLGEWVGLPRSAAGYYKLGGGMHIKKGANFAILDGAVVLMIKPTKATYNTKQRDTSTRTSEAAGSRLSAQQARENLTQARSMLKGVKKDTKGAQTILLELAERNSKLLTSTDLCYVYVYLGYIEDLAGNRQAAIGWFQKATRLDGPNIKGIRGVAEVGLTRAVTWIRHLDEGYRKAERQNKGSPLEQRDIIERIRKGIVLREEPKGIVPEMHLSKAERLENFDILAEAIDRHYSFFLHKGIDWKAVTSRYRPKVERTQTTRDFYSLIYKFVRELKDCHSWLCNYKDVPTLGRFSPEVQIHFIEGKALATEVEADSEAYMKGLRSGSIIVGVDGVSVKTKIERTRRLMRMTSSERCFLEEAYRRILDGEEGSTVSVKFLAPDGELPKAVRLRRVSSKKQEIIQPNFHVDKGKYIWYGIHPAGYGYIRILSFSGRLEIADEFDRALERLKDKPGLIIDVRENKGGFGTSQARIIGRFITARTKVDIGYRKNGPGHGDFQRSETYFEPTGAWQYTKPIALLINSITGSACDLFVARFISSGRPITVGATTHGNLTGVGAYVQLPCNLIVRVSNGYVCDANGRIIEGNGNEPQIQVEPTIADVVNGVDVVIERAVQELQQR